MPLRYLQLPEAQYIPKYQQLNTSLLNAVDTQIEGQVQQGRQQLNAYDAMVDTTMQNLANLPESQRLAFQEMANKTKAELDSSVSTQGYRNIQGSVRNLSKQFASQATPFLQRAEQVKAVNERLEKIGSRDARRFLQYQVALANESTPVNEKLELSSYIDVGDNWVDYADFAKKRKELLGTRNTTNIAGYNAQGMPVLNEMQLSNGIRAVMETRGRTADQTTSYLISEALSDSQMRAQLELEAKALAVSNSPVFAEMIDENGNFDPTKKVFVKFDKDGNVDEKSQPLTGVEVMALSKFGGIGEAMADYSAQVKYENALNGGADNIGLDITTLVDIRNPQTAETWYAGRIEALKNVNTSTGNLIMAVGETIGRTITADGDNLTVEVDGRTIPLAEYATGLPRAEQAQVQNLIESHRAGRIQVEEIKRHKELHLERIRQALTNNPATEPFAQAIRFNESSGKFDFNDSVTEILANNPSLIEVSWRSKVHEGSIPRKIASSLGENEITQTRLLVTGLEGAGLAGSGDERTIIKINGNFYDITDNNLIRNVRSVMDNVNDSFSKELSQSRDIVGAVFSSGKHRDLIRDFAEGGINIQGKIFDVNGETIKAHSMRIQSVSILDGVPTIVGIALDENLEPIAQNARFTGEEARVIARNELGDNYVFIDGANRISQLLPQSLGTGATSTFVSPEQVRNIYTSQGNLAGKAVEIQTVKVVNGSSNSTMYNVKINGQLVNESFLPNASAIHALLLDLNTN